MPPVRPGLAPNRPVTTSSPNFSYPYTNSPNLSLNTSNVSNLPLTNKSSPGSHSFTPNNIYSPQQTTTPSRGQSSYAPITDSPSTSIRPFSHSNSPYIAQQLTAALKTDTNSLRSEDSATSSDESLQPSSVQRASSIRNQDLSSPNIRHRPIQAPLNGNLNTRLTNTASSSTGTTISSAPGVPFDRVPSPSPSALSERERAENERIERELELKRKRLQIYVFICRCIACPFNSKQSSDMGRKHLKINLVQYGVIKERFLAFLNGKTHIEADEAFINAVRSYYEVFLKSERIGKMVQSGGCCSDDFRDVFRINIEKRVRSLPDIDSLKISKDTVLTLWMSKFDAIYRGQDQDQDTIRRLSRSSYITTSAELIMTKEQLYEMFQTVLNIKKFEHQ